MTDRTDRTALHETQWRDLFEYINLEQKLNISYSVFVLSCNDEAWRERERELQLSVNEWRVKKKHISVLSGVSCTASRSVIWISLPS